MTKRVVSMGHSGLAINKVTISRESLKPPSGPLHQHSDGSHWLIMCVWGFILRIEKMISKSYIWL